MFDRITVAQIQSAPRLKGTAPERLAADLTDAYVQVSIASALLNDDPEGVDDDLIARLISIARAQEVLALTLEEGETQQAAAYVAARAYQVVALSGSSVEAIFTTHSIPTQVSSMLLFIASDATPDAEEMAQFLESSGQNLEASLVNVLRMVGQSDFEEVANFEVPAFALPDTANPQAIAAYVGYFKCLQALSRMCEGLLSSDQGDWVPGEFERIRDELSNSFAVNQFESAVMADDTILGPWHLASLLNQAERVLYSSALTRVDSPEGVDRIEWQRLVTRIARRRPTLWRNHRDAVRANFLEPGTSAVVTFPTGAGKSTVTELKVAAAHLSKMSVIVLVPTLSLLDQQAHALRSTLPDARIIAQRDFEDEVNFDAPHGPAIFVLTPESCLALFSAEPDAFGEVGLIVFDEAHLLAAIGEVPGRRSLDAALCLLLLSRKFEKADIFLVSAMIGNAEVLRDWLEESTGRDAIALNDPWKPTRQARGAVIYRSEEIAPLNSMISAAQAAAKTKGPPRDLRRKMAAIPYGFFGLRTTWESRRQRDYRLLPLLLSPSPLELSSGAAGQGWRLTGNVNKTASEIAKAGAASGRKVLVFAQQVKFCVSASNDVNVGSQKRTALTRAENALLERAIEAAGGVEVLYGSFDGDHVLGESLPHHGLMLPEERRLHESVYRRRDGPAVLVATSTLAQGMNLPSEIVIIAGDRRFDSQSSRPQRLEAQELLNAAGRAGRAGMRSNGLVIVIPSYPISYDGAKSMGPGWFELQAAFSQSDQCVEVIDPIASLILAPDSEDSRSELGYLSRRLAGSEDLAETHRLISRSFGAYVARQEGAEATFEDRLAQVIAGFDSDMPAWVRSVVASTGLPAEDVLEFGARLHGELPATGEIVDWRDWVFSVLADRPSLLEGLLRSGSRAIFRGAPSEVGAEWERLHGQGLVEASASMLSSWMSGVSLRELEDYAVDLAITRKSTVHCEFARKFVLRVVPDLAYIFSLPRLIASRAGLAEVTSLSQLELLAAAVELGVDSEEKLQYMRDSVKNTRIGAHRKFR